MRALILAAACLAFGNAHAETPVAKPTDTARLNDLQDQLDLLQESFGALDEALTKLGLRVQTLEADKTVVPAAIANPAPLPTTSKPTETQPWIKGAQLSVGAATIEDGDIKPSVSLGAGWVSMPDVISFQEHKDLKAPEIIQLKSVAYQFQTRLKPESTGDHTLIVTFSAPPSRAPVTVCKAVVSLDGIKLASGTITLRGRQEAPPPFAETVSLTEGEPVELRVTASCVARSSASKGQSYSPVHLTLKIREPEALAPRPLSDLAGLPADFAIAQGAPQPKKAAR